MTGVLVLTVIVIIAFGTLRHLWVGIAVVVAVLVLVPQVAAPVIDVPGLSGLNVGSVLIIVIAAVQVAVRGRTYLEDAVDALPTTLALVGVMCLVALTSVSTGTTGDQQFLVDCVIPSTAVYFLVRRALDDDPRAGRWLAQATVSVVVIESVLALLIWAGVIPQPFAQQYETRYYWFDEEQARALGTADSPLELGVIVLIGVCLLQSIRRVSIIVPCAATFLVTIIAAQSRTALALAVVALVALLIRRRVPIVPAAAVALVTVIAVIGVASVVPDLGEGLAQKVLDDNGSAGARQIGITRGFPELLHHLLLGGGPDDAVTTATRLGLGTSFENPLLMLGLSWGALASCCWFGTMITVVTARGGEPRVVPGGRRAGAMAVIAVMTYSSVAFVTGLGTLLWVVLAFATAPRRVHRAGGAEDRPSRVVRSSRTSPASTSIALR